MLLLICDGDTILYMYLSTSCVNISYVSNDWRYIYKLQIKHVKWCLSFFETNVKWCLSSVHHLPHQKCKYATRPLKPAPQHLRLCPWATPKAPDGEQRAKAARREDNSRKTPKFECQSLILYTANRWITEKIKASTSWSPENPEDHIFKVRRTGGLTGITCQIFAFFQICVNLVK